MSHKFCVNCGQPVDQNANFCSYCGTAVAKKIDNPAQSPAGVSTEHQTSSELSFTPPEPISDGPVDPRQNIIERENTAPIAQVIFMLHYLKTTGALLIVAAIVAIVDPFMGLVIAICYLIILALSTHLVWSSYYFSIDETHFKKNYGILHKKSVTIPFDQIQNVNITRSLVDQVFGLAAIDIETAGNNKTESRPIVGGRMSRAEGHLSGIHYARAIEIHDILLKKVTAKK